MNNGWIKLHRSLLDWQWISDSKVLALFVHCLLRANHTKNKWQGYTIERGQFISGRKQLAYETGMTEQEVRTALSKLKKTGEVTIKTTNKFSFITIVNWDFYQSKDEYSNQQTNQQSTNNQPTTNQQSTTNKNDKNGENDKNERIQHIVDFYHQKCTGLSKVVSLTDKRKSAIKARIEEHGMEKVKEAIVKVSETPFLNGDNERGWKANIDFIMKPDSMAKILEDYYSQKTETNGRPSIPGL